MFAGTQEISELEPEFDLIGDILHSRKQGTRLWAELLSRRPTALTLRAGGADKWKLMMSEHKQAAIDLLEAMTRMEAETGDQTNEVFTRTVSRTADDVKNGVEAFAVQGTFPTGTTQIKLLWHGQSVSLRDTMERVRDHLNGDTSKRIRLDKDILMELAVIIDAFRQGMGLKETLALFKATLPQDTLDLINGEAEKSVEGLPSTVLSMIDLLLGASIEAVEFDLYTFGQRPMGLRDFFPAFTDQDPLQKQASLLLSYECARMGFGSATWTAGAPLVVNVSDTAATADKSRGPGNDTITVTVEARQGDATIDSEALTLTEHSILEGFFKGSLPTAASNSPTTGNGTLEVPNGATLLVNYNDGSVSPAIIVSASVAADGTATAFDFAQPCDESYLRDSTHFNTTLFGELGVFPEPPAAAVMGSGPYPVCGPDGITSPNGMAAWPSPSFNGLFWVDVASFTNGKATGFPTGASLGTPCITNAFVGYLPFVYKKLSAMKR